MNLSKQLDENLAHLCWSLWTELGCAGLERKHSSFSIAPEELILLTATLAGFDPRLRDEALDWCSSYHRFISTTRLKSLAKKYPFIEEPFSVFVESLNEVAHIKWPVLKKVKPLKIRLSRKSILRDFETPAMIYFRLRALFGVNARADIVVFFLGDKQGAFSVAEVEEIGYTKRHLAEILQDLASAGVLNMKMVGNQMRYSWGKREELIQLLGALPQRIIPWYHILAVILPIRDCIHRSEQKTVGTKVVEMRNLLKRLENDLASLNIKPPAMKDNLQAYWKDFSSWILDIATLQQFQ